MQRLQQIIVLSLSIISIQLMSEASQCIAAIIEKIPTTYKITRTHNQFSLDGGLQLALNENSSNRVKLNLNPNHSKRLNNAIGPRDSAILVAPDNSVIFSKNHQKQLMPASTLKIFTALLALRHLGESYRFATDFYLDSEQNLIIKGYGDPMLISESLVNISQQLALKVDTIEDIIIDNSYFQIPSAIPGKNNSLEPYDAPNGALCVNFNTVSFKTIQSRYVSGEVQTPLLPFAMAKVKSSGLKEGRIMLVGGEHETVQYAGELFQYFFTRAGIQINGTIGRGMVDQKTDRLILHHLSQFSLDEVITRLMEYSNNFIANQIFLTTGAHSLGSPATIAKAVQLSNDFANKTIGPHRITIVEGSGLSRQNRISAEAMIQLLDAFEPYYQLLRKGKQEYYKTGTLSDVKARAGYLEDDDGRRYPFAVLINTPGKTTDKIMKLFREIVNR